MSCYDIVKDMLFMLFDCLCYVMFGYVIVIDVMSCCCYCSYNGALFYVKLLIMLSDAIVFIIITIVMLCYAIVKVMLCYAMILFLCDSYCECFLLCYVLLNVMLYYVIVYVILCYVNIIVCYCLC